MISHNALIENSPDVIALHRKVQATTEPIGGVKVGIDYKSIFFLFCQ
jgi:hypothetical protein